MWVPQEDGLNELVNCLKLSSAPDTATQQQVQSRLESFNQIADYNAYLVYILTSLPSLEDTVRTMAGLLLKNNLRQRLKQLDPNVLDYVKSRIFDALGSSSITIRNTAGTVINQLVVALEPANFPEALSTLMELIESPEPAAQEGAFSALDKICQDVPGKLQAMVINKVRVLDFMVPKFIGHVSSSVSPRVRAYAINCLIQFIHSDPTTSLSGQNLEAFLAKLFEQATDRNVDVRNKVCQALVQLLASRVDVLKPHMDNVVDFMIYSTRDGDDDGVALEACEFWLTFAEDPDLVDVLRPYLPKVVPMLLQSMHYSDVDVVILDQNDGDDANVPDRPEDIKPHFISSKTHTNERSEEADALNGATNKGKGKALDPNAAEADEDEEEEEEDDDDDEDDEAYTEWNLRKCAAAAMDVMAITYEADLMVVLLPSLKEKLTSQDWLDRESGILALGAIAEGCIGVIEPDLPQLMPFLIGSLNDTKALVRSITCWTIGRYSSWTVKPGATNEHKQEYFVPALEGLLKMCLDNNKRVQEAGCSAFATLEEEAGSNLEPFLGSILSNLVFAFNKYQQKNLLILYDAIGTLADAVGGALNDKAYIDILMPSLINRWSTLDDSDPDLIPLLECLSSVVIAIGPGFVAYAQPVFERCTRIVHQGLLNFQAFQANPEQMDEPDRTFLIVALDLLSGLTQGLGSSVIPLFQSTQPSVMELLQACLQHPAPAVRQSAYALLGDTAISCFPLLTPALPSIIPGLVSHIELEPKADTISVCNNAAWCAGEIALQAGQGMEPYVPPLMEKLVPVLLSTRSVRSLMENAAVTIGRLAVVCPATVAPHLNLFISAWCQALADIKDNDEKDSAFQGICAAIQQNPNGVANHFGFFLNAVARWTRPSERLNEMFKSILVAFKTMSGDNWEAQLAHLPAEIVTRLRSRYPI